MQRFLSKHAGCLNFKVVVIKDTLSLIAFKIFLLPSNVSHCSCHILQQFYKSFIMNVFLLYYRGCLSIPNLLKTLE